MAVTIPSNAAKALSSLILPTEDFWRTDYQAPKKPYKGLDAFAFSLVGRYRRRSSLLHQLRRQAEAIDHQAGEWKQLTDHHLQERLGEFRRQFRRHSEVPESILLAAMAALREAADRQVGLRPFVVQLMGALAMHRGLLVEMATGEGKTLTAGLPAVLAAWTGRPCHIITANDYLVERDAEWLRPLYRFCGLTPGLVTGTMAVQDRRRGYAADVTYATSKEIIADFLRDRLRFGQRIQPARRNLYQMTAPHSQADPKVVMRGLHTAILDEADFLLIDEAVTPLIISTPRANQSLKEAVIQANQMIQDLQPGTDYTVNYRYREADLTQTGMEKIQSYSHPLPPVFASPRRRRELVQQALVAKELFLRDKQYVLVEGKIAIVDEFTGRLMHQRSWRAGLHQAIEAKEGVAITEPTETLSRLSFQRFFRLYYHLAGMTGTAYESAPELWQIYSLPVIRIPTNKPCVRQEHPDLFFASKEMKWERMVRDIAAIHRTGRPILVGTRSVAVSEELATRLTGMGISIRVLNAVRHREEAQIVAEAGQQGQVTIATNMAGRGTDIRLGSGIADLGGLHVIASERHESRRIDRQLFGRAARQGDPGSSQAYVSFEDELLVRFLNKKLRTLAVRAMTNNLPGSQWLASLCVSYAQKKAEYQAYHQRRGVLRTDTWLEEALSFSDVPEISSF